MLWNLKDVLVVGAFYTNQGYVCPKCTNKDNLELSQF